MICGETYTLRLMLSDGGDSSYDSGCFIEENSLTTGSVTVETRNGLRQIQLLMKDVTMLL